MELQADWRCPHPCQRETLFRNPWLFRDRLQPMGEARQVRRDHRQARFSGSSVYLLRFSAFQKHFQWRPRRLERLVDREKRNYLFRQVGFQAHRDWLPRNEALVSEGEIQVPKSLPPLRALRDQQSPIEPCSATTGPATRGLSSTRPRPQSSRRRRLGDRPTGERYAVYSSS